MDGNFAGSTDVFGSAANLTVYEHDNGQYTIQIDENGKYLGAIVSGNFINFNVQDDEYFWDYDKTYDTYKTTLENKTVFMGTSNNFSTFSLSNYDVIEEEDRFIAHIDKDEIPAPEAGSVSISAKPTTIKVDETSELSYKLAPLNSVMEGEISYEFVGEDEGIASIEGNIVTGLAEGSVQVVGKIGTLTSNPITINVITEDTPAGDSVVYKYEPAFDSANGNISNNAYNSRLNEANDVLNTLNDIDGEESPNLISAVSDFDNVFRSSTPNSGIKFSTGSKKGTLTFSTSSLVSKIDVTYIGWAKDTPSLEIKAGNDEPIKQGSAEATDGLTEETFTYTFTTPSTEFEFAAGKTSDCRFVITKLVFWLA